MASPLRHRLFRAHFLARRAAALLAVGGLLSVVLALMPDAFYRFLAVPNGVAKIGLGVSLWRSARTEHNAADIGSPRSSRHGSSLTELGSA